MCPVEDGQDTRHPITRNLMEQPQPRRLFTDTAAATWARRVGLATPPDNETPHSVTGETANLLMLGRELRLPDQLQRQPLPPPPIGIDTPE